MKLSKLSILMTFSLFLAAQGFANYEILLCRVALEEVVPEYRNIIQNVVPGAMHIFLRATGPNRAEYFNFGPKAGTNVITGGPAEMVDKDHPNAFCVLVRQVDYYEFTDLSDSIRQAYRTIATENYRLTRFSGAAGYNCEEATERVMNENGLGDLPQDFKNDEGAIAAKAALKGINYVVQNWDNVENTLNKASDGLKDGNCTIQ